MRGKIRVFLGCPQMAVGLYGGCVLCPLRLLPRQPGRDPPVLFVNVGIGPSRSQEQRRILTDVAPRKRIMNAQSHSDPRRDTKRPLTDSYTKTARVTGWGWPPLGCNTLITSSTPVAVAAKASYRQYERTGG